MIPHGAPIVHVLQGLVEARTIRMEVEEEGRNEGFAPPPSYYPPPQDGGGPANEGAYPPEQGADS